MKKTAVISPCGEYRYRLEREWDSSLPKVAFMMLNPSTADDKEDDPTIRRCIGFAKSWGYGGIVVVNLFAIRGADPTIIKTHPSPIGPANNEWIHELTQSVAEVVCAWGSHAMAAARARDVLNFLGTRRTVCIKVTKSGSPGHPLYVKSTAERMPYKGERLT